MGKESQFIEFLRHWWVGSLLQPSFKRSSSDCVGGRRVLRQPEVHHLLPLAHQVREKFRARDQVFIIGGSTVDEAHEEENYQVARGGHCFPDEIN